jgi:tetratricopeptide (TPR) repeat protein
MIRTLYSEGWALYHYIQLGRPELAPGLGRFIRLMASPDGDVASNVQAAFGRDLGSLESDFMTYARNTLRFPAAEKTLAQRLPEVETSRPVEIPESEASFYLGDLLLHLQGPDDDARLYLERSLELGGEFEPALTALYVLNDRQGNDAEAAEFLNRALAAPDAGYLPHLLRARKALVEEPFEEVAAEAETHLRFVVSRRPELPDGHYWLGQLLMRRPEMFEEGIRELETAVETSGADPQMRLAYARALWVSGNDLRAQGLLMGLAQTTADPAVQVEVRRLQEEISRLTAARAASEDQELQARAAAQQPFPASPEPRSTEPPRSTPPASPTLTGSTIPRPILPEGMSSIEGRISYIGCLDAFQLVIVSAEGTLRLSAPGLANIELASYSPAVRGEMPCGDIEPALPARVIYRPAADPASGVDGEPVRVDFLP